MKTIHQKTEEYADRIYQPSIDSNLFEKNYKMKMVRHACFHYAKGYEDGISQLTKPPVIGYFIMCWIGIVIGRFLVN